MSVTLDRAAGPLGRLTDVQRCEIALGYVDQRVTLVFDPARNPDGEVTGWVVSVAMLAHGTTRDVITLRADQDRTNKDIAYSLAQVVSIEPEDPR